MDSLNFNDNSIYSETLDLLEWPRLCMHLSKFASTVKGIQHCKKLTIPDNLSVANLRLQETLEIGKADTLTQDGLSFKDIHNLDDTLTRCFKGGIETGERLLALALTLSSASRLRRQILEVEDLTVLSNLVGRISTCPGLEKSLKFGLEDGGRLADRASTKLSSLRFRRNSLCISRNELLQSILNTFGSILQEKIITERYGRPVISVKSAFAKQIPGLVHDSSSSGGTVFLEPDCVISLGNHIRELEVQIKEEENRLLAQWSAMVSENYTSLRELDEVLLKLDVALARARYGRLIEGVPAYLNDEINSPFSIKDFRHPLLIWQQHWEHGNEVVPIDIDVNSSTKVVTVTGPNTGGKTVSLKSIGLAVLMARAGLLLPCKKCINLPFFTQVLADIGDDQSIQQNLSTFSGHVKRISKIFESLKDTDGSSLVLLDEVGGGTDPTEGNVLAISILQELSERTRLTIATTHFGELKALKYTDSRFENASVAFDIDKLSPTYVLQWGIPGRSNAIAIATKLGLELKVVKKAKELLSKDAHLEVNEIIKGLEDQRVMQQNAAEEAAALLAQAELLHEELLARWKQYSDYSDQYKERGRQELDNAIKNGQAEVRNLIRQLRNQGANGETARRVGQRLRRMESEFSILPKRKFNNGWKPYLGERIRVIPLGKAGEVISISDDGKKLVVRCGLLRSKLDLSEVESLDGRKPLVSKPIIDVKTNFPISTSTSSVRTSLNTIDVRGLRVHEAEIVVEERIRSSQGPLWVIHGIGTGKLKKGLREWLLGLPYVERLSDADQSDGGAGCTVVWLS